MVLRGSTTHQSSADAALDGILEPLAILVTIEITVITRPPYYCKLSSSVKVIILRKPLILSYPTAVEGGEDLCLILLDERSKSHGMAKDRRLCSTLALS